MLLLVVAMLLIVDLLTLMLGVAGMLHRGRKKTFAATGVVVSVLVLAFVYTQGLAWEAPSIPRGGTTIGAPSDP